MKNFTKKVIVFDDKKCCVLLQTEYKNSNYFLTVGVDDAETKFDNKYELLEGKEENGKCFFRTVTDKALYDEVSKKLFDENKEIE